MKTHYSYRKRFTESAFFGYGIAIALCVAVVYGIYQFYAVVYMPEHDACEARGGIIVLDAFNVPTCATNSAVIINNRRRR